MGYRPSATWKYPPGFTHFAYVNPDAPKGGRLSMIGTAGRITFDSFNGYIPKGDAAQGVEYLFDSLMTRARRAGRRLRGLSRARPSSPPTGAALPGRAPRPSSPTARR